MIDVRPRQQGKRADGPGHHRRVRKRNGRGLASKRWGSPHNRHDFSIENGPCLDRGDQQGPNHPELRIVGGWGWLRSILHELLPTLPRVRRGGSNGAVAERPTANAERITPKSIIAPLC